MKRYWAVLVSGALLGILAVYVVLLVLPVPADAQNWGDRRFGDRRRAFMKRPMMLAGMRNTSVAMVVDGQFLYVLLNHVLFKIDKNTMEIVKELKLRPKRKGMGQKPPWEKRGAPKKPAEPWDEGGK